MHPESFVGYFVIALFRIVAIFFYFLILNIVLITVCILRPFHRNNVYMAARLYSTISILLGVKIELRLPQSVKSGGPYVFIANHQNSFDLITVGAAVMKGTVSVGKKSLVWIPVFGWLYWLSGNILIDRKNKGSSSDTLKNTIQKMLKRSLSVWFFPEGTRSYGRGLLPFKSGAFRIAKETNAKVVVVATSELHNTIKLNRWSNGTLIIEVKEPENMDENKSLQQNMAHFHQKMGDTIKQLNEELANPSK